MGINILFVISIYLIFIKSFWVYADVGESTDESKTPNGQETYSARVLAGNRVSIKDYAYNVYVVIGNEDCGGVIIDRRWILTARHCRRKRTDSIVVYVNFDHEHEAYGYPVEDSIQHPLYKTGGTGYDYMLLKLKHKLKLSATVQVIPMASQSDFADGQLFTLTGYGDKNQPHFRLPCFGCERGKNNADLHAVQLQMVSRDRCMRMRPSFGDLPENVFCAGTKHGRAASCLGDSGSPYVYNGRLMGIVYGRYINGICPRTPVIVSSVPYVRPWISQVTNI